MLNLQATNSKLTGMTSSVDSQVESAVFQRVIGSLGSSIAFEDNSDGRVSRQETTDGIMTAGITSSHGGGAMDVEEVVMVG